MENLPEDILQTMLSRLPKESVLPIKRVCNAWRMLLGDNIKVGLLFALTSHNYNGSSDLVEPYYGDEHPCGDDQTVLTKLDKGKLVFSNGNGFMVGSCNGLVCFRPEDVDANKCVAYIYNPMTGEPIHIERFKNLRVCGFGYVRSTNEYKVVGTDLEYFYVYTLGRSRGWRLVTRKRIISNNNEMGVFANGAFHWFNWIYKKGSGLQLKIEAFDLATEKFRTAIAPPPPMIDYKSRRLNDAKLLLLGGNLCCVQTDRELHYMNCKKKNHLNIWMFNKAMSSGEEDDQHGCCYDNTWSWSNFSTISWADSYRNYTPISITRSNIVLLWESHKGHLCSYDPSRTSKIEKLWEWDSYDHKHSSVQVIPHMNSFLSLKDLSSPRMTV